MPTKKSTQHGLPGGRAYYRGKDAYASQSFENETRQRLETLETGTLAALPDLDGNSVLGRSAATSGVMAAITAAVDGYVLRLAGAVLGFGQVVTAGIADAAITTAKIVDAAVTYAKLQDVAGLSVFGRSANSSGVGADITGTDGQLLRVSGTTLGFGTAATAGIADGAITMAKLADLAGLSIIGRGANSTGVPAAITGVDGNVLRVAGTALGFGAIATAGITDAAVTYAKIQNVSATDKVLGRSSSGAGVVEEIACTAAGRALIDDADASAQHTTLGLGTLATQNGTFSGTSSGTNTGDQTITLTGDVTGSGTGSFAATIASNAVTDTKLRDSGALSVIGRASNSSGDPADISTSADGDVLRRSGTTLGFGSIATAGITDAAVTMAKLANLAGLSVNGRSASTSGVPAAITSGGADQVLRADGTNSTIGFGTLATGALASGAVTYAKIQDVAGLSVVGRSASTSGVSAAITSGGADQVLRADSTNSTIGFGTLATGAIASGAVTYAKIQNVAALSVMGNGTNSAAAPADVTASTDGHILRRSGTALGFGKILTNFITGTATNDSATAGDIGEYVESVVSAGSVGSWSTDTPKNITSISLTAGDWDVSGFGMFQGTITGTATQFSISTTSATTNTANIAQVPVVPSSTSEVYLALPTHRLSLSGTTTVYLVGRIKFSGGTPLAGGTLRARRPR